MGNLKFCIFLGTDKSVPYRFRIISFCIIVQVIGNFGMHKCIPYRRASNKKRNGAEPSLT